MPNTTARWYEYLCYVRLWFRRFGHRRCWRIHSPSAYRFVREVIFASPSSEEKALLTKAHRTARHAYADHSWLRYHRLVYRLARYQATHTTTPLHWHIVTGEGQSSLLPYLQAAAERSPERSISIAASTPEAWATSPRPTLLYIDHPCPATYASILWQAIASATADTLIIVRHIHRTPEATALWQRIEHHPHTTVTFDAHYWGLIRFAEGLSKEAHVLCF